MINTGCPFFFSSPVPVKFAGSLCEKQSAERGETMPMPFNSNVKSINVLKWQEKTSL